MLWTIGFIGLVLLVVGCALFLGLAPSERARAAERVPMAEPSRFFVALPEHRPPEDLVDALVRDLEAHIREEGRIAEGFALQMDPKALHARTRSAWVN